MVRTGVEDCQTGTPSDVAPKRMVHPSSETKPMSAQPVVSAESASVGSVASSIPT